VRPRDLPHQVLEGLDADMIRINGEHPADLSGGTRRSWGTITSTTKHPPDGRWAAALAKTAS
jgi:hypothetical protein